MIENIISVYVDTNIISGLARRDFPHEVVEDFWKILDLRKSGKLKLYVSEITSNEIDKIPQEFRYYHELIYRLLDNISIKSKGYNNFLVTKGLGGGPASIITKGMVGSVDPLLIKIERIIPKKSNEKDKNPRSRDIEHLFQFKKNNLDIFWTEDIKTILNNSSELATLGIRVLKSRELIELYNS